MPPKPKIGIRIKGGKADYELLELLNEGDMSWALRAKDCTHGGKTVFLKYYKSPTPAVSWYQDYLSYVNELNRRLEEGAAAQYCVLCTDQFKTNPKPGSANKTEYFFQVYDFIEKGLDLRDMLEKQPDWEKRKAMAKVFLVGMKKIHEAGIVHCDLKPENVQMLPNPSTSLGLIPRLIDMDRSILCDKPAPWTCGGSKEGYTGTPGYFSPEHLSGKTPQKASDVFTVGIILGELLGGKHPFAEYTADKDAYKLAVLKGGKHSHVVLLGALGSDPKNAKRYAELIEQCFDPSPGKRPTCERLHKMLLELDRKSSSQADPTPPPPDTPPSLPPVAVPGAVVLTGNVGSHRVRLPMDLGKVLLVKASSEAHYAGRQQFRIEKDDAGWYVVPSEDMRQPLTTLNGQVVTERSRLNTGDKIALQGRKSGAKAMELTVTLED